MPALGFTWTTWVALGAGALVASFVLGSHVIYRRWRYPLNAVSREEDLPWDELLSVLEKRNNERAAAGLPPEEVTEKEVDQMLARLPVPAPRPQELPEDREFALSAGAERRAGRRRWGNPTEIYIQLPAVTDGKASDLEDFEHGLSFISAGRIKGLVVNRATGGLGIYADREIPIGTFVTIRAVEAPFFVPSVLIEVRHCLKANKGFILGCQFCNDIPWKIRVWFG
jgi:hypothetical protein